MRAAEAKDGLTASQPLFGPFAAKEKFKGKPDMAKGSFYANPLWDDPAEGDEAVRAKCAVRGLGRDGGKWEVRFVLLFGAAFDSPAFVLLKQPFILLTTETNMILF